MANIVTKEGDALPLSEPKFKVGERVHWTNEQGVDLGVRTITEVLEPDKFGNRYYITPNEAHWMYVREKNLALPASENYPEFGCF